MYETSEYADFFKFETFLSVVSYDTNYNGYISSIIYHHSFSLSFIYLPTYLSRHPTTIPELCVKPLQCSRLCTRITLPNKINTELISVPKLNLNLYHIAFFGHLQVTSLSLEFREHLHSKDFI